MKIYYYKIYLFGKKEPIEVDQMTGQRLAMDLVKNPNRRFILINDDVINTSSIEQVVKEKLKTPTYDSYGILQDIHLERELTPDEKEVQELYEKFTNKKLLLKGKNE